MALYSFDSHFKEIEGLLLLPEIKNGTRLGSRPFLEAGRGAKECGG
jgi:hypothetical protein